mmetsp:Transcript_32334/g.89343  ORF Transcript_32334/g.89343 Transcript_32334/m.89343 type:complete len:226 (-) Transcript_32334:163-840(-)
MSSPTPAAACFLAMSAARLAAVPLRRRRRCGTPVMALRLRRLQWPRARLGTCPASRPGAGTSTSTMRSSGRWSCFEVARAPLGTRFCWRSRSKAVACHARRRPESSSSISRSCISPGTTGAVRRSWCWRLACSSRCPRSASASRAPPSLQRARTRSASSPEPKWSWAEWKGTPRARRCFSMSSVSQPLRPGTCCCTRRCVKITRRSTTTAQALLMAPRGSSSTSA